MFSAGQLSVSGARKPQSIFAELLKNYFGGSRKNRQIFTQMIKKKIIYKISSQSKAYGAF